MIVVTTPTGHIGQQVIPHLLEAGEPVRVIVRDPDRLPPHVREQVEVVQGSHGDIEVVTKAFAGADAVFWVVPPNPQARTLDALYLDFTRPACEALVSQGVGHVVGVSALGRGVNVQAGHITASLAMDDMIAATGVNYRALTMPSFMENLLRQVEGIRDRGVFAWPIDPDLKAPICATRDIAAVGARLLLDRSWTGFAEVPVLGPEDLSHREMMQIMSEVLGRPVRYEQVTMEALKASLTGRGVPEAIAQGMVEMSIAKNEGLDNAEPRTPEATTPTTFRQWCEDVLKPAVQS
jgi:uncharacterized protein YbjT (DUF2867 family)